ncbi:hypothetical protein GCM10020366_04680 [Saccharopolyspora gregorii]|uniref:Uncharacterized protein n=1 Tax=Saccharopolyspora gregorii TaxID=33914 RepID=A0ABP6RIY2_9PSEU
MGRSAATAPPAARPTRPSSTRAHLDGSVIGKIAAARPGDHRRSVPCYRGARRARPRPVIARRSAFRAIE